MEIKVSTFYNCQALYPYMPRAIFDALEAAWLDGRELASVPAEAFLLMREEAPAEVWPE